jgi:hypothetical protein
MKLKKAKTLPKILNGSVHAQWVTCGKPGCKCARGELHGPYFYLFWRENGRLRKTYVRRQDLSRVLIAISSSHHDKQLATAGWHVFRRIRERVRTAEDKMSNSERGSHENK